MYVCLCKALTEAEVIKRTQCALNDGVRSPEGVMKALGLECEEACGFCIENPEHIIAIFEDELETHRGYSTPVEHSVQNA